MNKQFFLIITELPTKETGKLVKHIKSHHPDCEVVLHDKPRESVKVVLDATKAIGMAVTGSTKTILFFHTTATMANLYATKIAKTLNGGAPQLVGVSLKKYREEDHTAITNVPEFDQLFKLSAAS